MWELFIGLATAVGSIVIIFAGAGIAVAVYEVTKDKVLGCLDVRHDRKMINWSGASKIWKEYEEKGDETTVKKSKRP